MKDTKMSESTYTNTISGKKRKASENTSNIGSINKNMKVNDTEGEESIVTVSRSKNTQNPDNTEKAKYDWNAEYEEDDEEDTKIKWKTLEHHGVRFPPFYQPHGVKLLHKGKPLNLKPNQEEIATFWAAVVGTDFAEVETVRKNFEEELLSVLDPEMGVESMKDLDFSLITKHLEKAKEEKNNRTSEEKKKEREQNAKLETHFRY